MGIPDHKPSLGESILKAYPPKIKVFWFLVSLLIKKVFWIKLEIFSSKNSNSSLSEKLKTFSFLKAKNEESESEKKIGPKWKFELAINWLGPTLSKQIEKEKIPPL